MDAWPLMQNNITEEDTKILIDFLSQRPVPIFTNNKKVKEFEEEWSKWLGVKYSIFVNSGNSANVLTLANLQSRGIKEVIVSPLNWVSDISSILLFGMKPVFCDINLHTLSLDENQFEKKITSNTKAVLITHILGYNGLTSKILELCNKNHIYLVEDVCESHGAVFQDKKLGSFGFISNFSFYYAHHMTSIEGGMVCTNSENVYNHIKCLRSHGMVREMDDGSFKTNTINGHTGLNKDFIFIYPSFNMRSTELNAVLALNQLKRLDTNNQKRKENLDIFLDNLNNKRYFTEFNRKGNSNYAFTLLLKDADFELRDKVESILLENQIEFRRGMSGGGNQLRQPYLKSIYKEEYKKYPNCEHVHHFGLYIGNYPDLPKSNIIGLCNLLNKV